MCSIEDVANLTASDVMNRVNLGYLQGNSAPVTTGHHTGCANPLPPWLGQAVTRREERALCVHSGFSDLPPCFVLAEGHGNPDDGAQLGPRLNPKYFTQFCC